jgi:AcrR family transcriptional regulator
MTASTTDPTLDPGVAPTDLHDAGAPVISRRERKKLETRQALRREALRLFAERGFDATTIQDITEAADVAPRTFFLHFASKEDVLTGGTDDRGAEFEEALASRPRDEPGFVAVRETILTLLREDPTPDEEKRLQVRLMIASPGLFGRVFEHYVGIEEAVSRAVADRVALDVDRDAYPRLLATCAMNAVRVALVLWYERADGQPLDAVVAELFGVLGDGLDRST